MELAAMKSFLKLTFDNADFNVNTLVGLRTFHALGLIMMVTPTECILPEGKIARVDRCSAAKVPAWLLEVILSFKVPHDVIHLFNDFLEELKLLYRVMEFFIFHTPGLNLVTFFKQFLEN